jgi:hypothetical protein
MAATNASTIVTQFTTINKPTVSESLLSCVPHRFLTLSFNLPLLLSDKKLILHL